MAIHPDPDSDSDFDPEKRKSQQSDHWTLILRASDLQQYPGRVLPGLDINTSSKRL
ncbi:hypothetical protein [Desulfovermiculus halophilus]|jgi:hypothetical protein|uniref:hypothetical protein n=1 Tax=Desulfovermiculus halophilus TaxID=339722 RepID=UPI0012946E2C|nr:hypothetical protein [Desulfovermiculus halophilus]